MTNRITDVDNFFSTTLTSDITAASTTIPVASTGSLTSPCIITINGDTAGAGDDTREVLYCDGSFTGTTFSTSDRAANSLLSGGAKVHTSGSVVEVRVVAEHIDDLNDRVTAHTHAGSTDGTQVDHADLTGLGGDDHVNLLNTTRHDVTTRHPITVLGDGSGLGLRQVVVFSVDGTFTKADYSWLRSVRVRVQGAGGGAGGVPSTSAGEASASGAGGGGGYSEAFIDVGTLGTNETVTVGTGGAGGAAGLNNGTAGGDSSFGTHATGGGGGAGTAETVLSVTADLRPALNAAGGTGGTAADGDINIPGASGEGGLVSTLRVATARGGSSFLSTSVGRRDVTLTTTPGVDGQAYGGGGGGAANAESQGSKAGGDGADGVVIVELYG